MAGSGRRLSRQGQRPAGRAASTGAEGAAGGHGCALAAGALLRLLGKGDACRGRAEVGQEHGSGVKAWGHRQLAACRQQPCAGLPTPVATFALPSPHWHTLLDGRAQLGHHGLQPRLLVVGQLAQAVNLLHACGTAAAVETGGRRHHRWHQEEGGEGGGPPQRARNTRRRVRLSPPLPRSPPAIKNRR